MVMDLREGPNIVRLVNAIASAVLITAFILPAKTALGANDQADKTLVMTQVSDNLGPVTCYINERAL
jgi:hypothetical protein